MYLRRKRPDTRWLLKLFSIFVIVFSLTTLFGPLKVVNAANWIGWNGISAIYYNTAQESPGNTFLATATQELQTYLGQMAGRSFTITHNYPPARPSILTSTPTTPIW